VGGCDTSLRLTGPQPALLYLAPSCVSSVLVASWRQVAHTKSHQCIQHPTRRFNRLGAFARLREDWSRSWFLPRDSLDPHAELGQSHSVTRALLALQSPKHAIVRSHPPYQLPVHQARPQAATCLLLGYLYVPLVTATLTLPLMTMLQTQRACCRDKQLPQNKRGHSREGECVEELVAC
jgi:hypothetical protein